jgi:hypothetical protein
MKGPVCPTGPIERASIELGKGILRVLDLHHGVGTRLMRFDIGGYPDNPQSLTAAREDSDAEPERSAPWIEDESFKELLRLSPSSRSYRLYYPTPKAVPNRAVRPARARRLTAFTTDTH